MNNVIFFVFDPSPRIERRIDDFVNAGFVVEVYGYKYDITNVDYCNSPNYTYNVLETIPHGISYRKRLAGLASIRKVSQNYDHEKTLFYFFSLNVAAIAPFLKIKYVYEESDMLFDRFQNAFARKIVIAFNKYVIKRSAITVMTSKGFENFYYGKEGLSNIEIVPNKVNSRCRDLPVVNKRPFDACHIRFGFAGNIRYKATLSLARIIARHFPNHEFHFWGNTESLNSKDLDLLNDYSNIFLHGVFKNPEDLPSIYAAIDFCVCNYDIDGINPRYAEPNKLYEALFFNTPIMVSPGTYLGKKVKALGVGFDIDSYNETTIKRTIDSITESVYSVFINNIKLIPKESLITDNTTLINRIRGLK